MVEMKQVVELSEEVDLAIRDDGSIEIGDAEQSIVLDEDGAYKLFVSLQSMLFPNVPTIESLNLA